jgi:hypothetical protein
MDLPSPGALGKAVVLTAVSLIIINWVKPYLPEPVQRLLSS